MSVNIVNPSTGSLTTVGGTSNVHDVETRIDDIEAVIPSTASSSNKLATASDLSADSISYNNTTSGLSATEVQSAIDEVNSEVGTLDSAITTTNNNIGDLTDLDTTDQSSIVGAVNEIAGRSSDYHVFNTTEQAVGEWVDGNIIYEKTYTATGVSLSVSTVIDGTLTTSNTNLINVDGTFVSSGASGVIPMPFSYYDSNGNVEVYARLLSTGVTLTLTNRTITGYNITIKYTKIT